MSDLLDRLLVRRDGEPTRLAWLWITWRGWERSGRPLERDLSDFQRPGVLGDARDH